jgi:hypothetical protein
MEHTTSPAVVGLLRENVSRREQFLMFKSATFLFHFLLVARIERSKIREALRGELVLPDFASLNPGYKLQVRDAVDEVFKRWQRASL